MARYVFPQIRAGGGVTLLLFATMNDLIKEEELLIDNEMDEDEEDIDDEMAEEEEGVDVARGDVKDEDDEEEEEELKQCWVCKTCDAVFFDLEDYKSHLYKLHKLTKEVFTLDDNENPALRDYKASIPQNLQPCSVCQLQFTDMNALTLHLVRRHGSPKSLIHRVSEKDKRFPCPKCSGEMTAEDLQHHIKKVHSLDGVVCHWCGKILSKTCTLNRHIEQVHLNLQIHKKATCHICGKIFSKKGHLDRHIKTIHMGQKDTSAPCPKCDKVFSTKSSLQPHIDMVHDNVRKKCPECGKVLSDLWKHMRTVHGRYRRRQKTPKDSSVLLAGGDVSLRSTPSPHGSLGSGSASSTSSGASSMSGSEDGDAKVPVLSPPSSSTTPGGGNKRKSTPKKLRKLQLEDDDEDFEINAEVTFE